jgi:hypothetical protein
MHPLAVCWPYFTVRVTRLKAFGLVRGEMSYSAGFPRMEQAYQHWPSVRQDLDHSQITTRAGWAVLILCPAAHPADRMGISTYR